MDDQSWYDDYRAKQREYDRRYREKRDADPIKAARTAAVKRAQYLRRRDRSAYMAQYRQDNRARINANNSKLAASKPLSHLLRKVKHSAKRRGLEFSLTINDVHIPDVCPVLGIPLVFPGPHGSPNLPSFDRVDNSLGYVPGNVRIISLRANTLKRDCTSADELRAVADYIDRHRKDL